MEKLNLEIPRLKRTVVELYDEEDVERRSVD